MNQRIRELHGQCKVCDKDTVLYFDYEKFAQLIVAECIDIAQDRANFPGYPPNDVNDIIDEIREHFGVEE